MSPQKLKTLSRTISPVSDVILEQITMNVLGWCKCRRKSGRWKMNRRFLMCLWERWNNNWFLISQFSMSSLQLTSWFQPLRVSNVSERADNTGSYWTLVTSDRSSAGGVLLAAQVQQLWQEDAKWCSLSDSRAHNSLICCQWEDCLYGVVIRGIPRHVLSHTKSYDKNRNESNLFLPWVTDCLYYCVCCKWTRLVFVCINWVITC